MVASLDHQWWEIYVQVPESLSEAASAYLHGLGSTAVVFHEQAMLTPQHTVCIETQFEATAWTVLQGALPLEDTLSRHVAALQQWLSTCAGETPDVQLYCRPLLDADYLTQWQQFFPPLCIGERLMIRPPWDTSPVPATMACLTLNPGPAFGTGTHPSTHLCLLMLLQYAAQCQGSRLLDVGCGSGILSLAALQLGWQSAVGVDIDAQAIAVATHNAELNGLQDRARFLHGSWQSVTGAFPCITANIYLGPLVEMLQPLTRYLAPGGTIILSGLLASQEATMRTAIQNAELTVQARRGEEEWVALAVRRARDVEQESLHVGAVMDIHRICVPPETLRQSTITLSPSIAHYIRHVLRLRVGDEITAFDGTGQECLVRLTSVAETHVQGERLALLAPTMLAPTPLILGQALPKGPKMDVIVEKCSELGLTTLVPLHTERTVVREASERLATKMARWQRIAAAAARQCGRRILLDVQPPMALRDFCGRYGSAPVKLVCWEEERQQGIRQVLERLTGQSPIVILIGPEGGLTVHEVEMARTEGFITVSLGSHLLRTETAAIVLTGIVRYSLGDLEPSRDHV